jgi:hypothetical protein
MLYVGMIVNRWLAGLDVAYKSSVFVCPDTRMSYLSAASALSPAPVEASRCRLSGMHDMCISFKGRQTMSTFVSLCLSIRYSNPDYAFRFDSLTIELDLACIRSTYMYCTRLSVSVLLVSESFFFTLSFSLSSH